ncbi:MAG TPA: tetratricopeptide repeat protein, partial [Verrucomicrobiota bacterium]|nr:tetratricopeptide repeat protein [Verrucomicrobiota bacterium]
VSDDRQVLLNQIARIDQQRPADVTADIKDAKRLLIRITTDGTTLAEWVFPLDLPARTPPPRKKAAETPAELVVSAWQHFLLARFDDAERDFKKALEKDPQCYDALVGLANIETDRAPARAADYARAAIAVDPNSGRAQYALAVAEHRLDLEGRSTGNAKQHFKTALDAAWKATCDPLTAIPARALVARLLIRDSKVAEAAQVLGEPGPWQADPVCRGLLAYCLSARVAGNGTKTTLSDSLARQNLEVDPLDLFSRLVLALNKDTEPIVSFVVPEGTDRKSVVNLIAQVRDIGGRAILSSLAIDRTSEDGLERTASESPARGPKRRQNSVSVMDRYDALMADDWPWRYTDLPELYAKYNANSRDGKLALSLGHLLFHLGRHDAAREMWKKADELGVEPAIANRALGMAALTLDNNLDSALMYLTKAHEADPKDAIIARDLSRVLHRIADASDSPERKKEAWQRARDSLQSAFEQGKGRSDFVALLARSLMRLGDYPATAKLLDSVRITIWEGAREAHDLFEEAHLALGEEHLQAGRAAEALAEFNRALEYPANLATGRLENAREAHIHYLRGKALAALGKRDEAIAAWKLAAEEPPSGDPKKERARENARKELDTLH